MRVGRRTLIAVLARSALVPAAALAVHQLRFALAFGSGAAPELGRDGHAYLHSWVPWIVLLVAVACGGFLCALGRAMRGQRSLSRYTLSLAGLWIICSLCLLMIYVTQELLEGLLAAGHPAGLAGVFGYGGWWSIPAAASIGLVLAAIFHGARWVLDDVYRRTTTRASRPSDIPPPPLRVTDLHLPRIAPLAGGWSGRAPPVSGSNDPLLGPATR